MPSKRSIESGDAVALADGVHVTPMSCGERIQMNYVRMDPGSRVDTHHHPNEQVTFVTAGQITLIIDGDPVVLTPGESVVIPGGAEHTAEAGDEEATAIDLFSPPRDDLPSFD